MKREGPPAWRSSPALGDLAPSAGGVWTRRACGAVCRVGFWVRCPGPPGAFPLPSFPRPLVVGRAPFPSAGRSACRGPAPRRLPVVAEHGASARLLGPGWDTPTVPLRAERVGAAGTSVSRLTRCRARRARSSPFLACRLPSLPPFGVGVPSSVMRPQIRRGDPLNLSILVSGGKETNQDSLSNGE